MKKILFLLLLLTSFSGFSQAEKIEENFNSFRLGEVRSIFIHLPESYQRSPKKKYPLLFLMDGDYLYDPFLGALNFGVYFDDFPEVIIVGVNQNINHERDTDCAVEEGSGLPEEKTRKFFEFIGMELIPTIQKKYRVAPFKIIAGHDLTAGFINLFLFNDEPLFNGYISFSSELPTSMDTLLAERFNNLNSTCYYYQSSSDSDDEEMLARIKIVDEAAKLVNKPNFSYRYDEFKNTSHYSVVLNSIPNALNHIFSAYRPIPTSEYNEKIVTLQSGYVDYLKNKYDVLEKQFNVKMPIRFIDFIAIKSAIIKNQAYGEMEQLADLAKKVYPKSMLGDYLLAVMYESKEDFSNAKKSFKTAYQREAIGDLTKTMMLDKVYLYKDYQ